MNFSVYNIDFDWGTFDYRASQSPDENGLTGVIFRVEYRYKGSLIVPRIESTELNPQYKVISEEIYGVVNLPAPNPMNYMELEALLSDKDYFRGTLIQWMDAIFDNNVKNRWKDTIYNKLQLKVNPSILSDSI